MNSKPLHCVVIRLVKWFSVHVETHQAHTNNDSLVGRVIEWLADWLVYYLFYWLADWSVGC